MNKKAIELSINFIIIMILSIAIFSSSLILVKQFFGKAEKMKAAVDSETETKIRSLLVAGERVAIPVYTKETIASKPVTFALGISNILKDTPGPTDTFTITVGDGGDKMCKPVSGGGSETLAVTFIETMEIPKNGDNIALLVVDTKDGISKTTYKCDVKVTYGNPAKNYADPVYKAYVKIK